MSSDRSSDVIIELINDKKTKTNMCKKFKDVYNLKAITRTKKIEPHEPKLHRVLKIHDLLGYGVGCTVGAGIYSLIASGAELAGSAVLISYLIGAIACVFTALVYSEFATRVPEAGSAYTFSYTSFGELIGWIIGWALVMEYAISAAAISRSFGSYFVSVFSSFGLDVPSWINDIYLGGTILSPISAALCLLCTLIMIFGVKHSSTFNIVVTVINIVILLFFCIAGAILVKPSNWSTGGSFAPFGVAGIFAGAGKLFFSYLGFDMVSSLAEEVKKPQRDMPIGIIGSLSIASVIYVGVSLVATGMIPFTLLNANAAPLADAFNHYGWSWAATIVTFGSLVGTTAATFTCLLGQPRIFYRMSQDGLFFPIFGKVNEKTGVPIWGTIIVGVLTAIIAFFTTLDFLADAISVGTLLAFTMVDAGLLVIRYKKEDNGKKIFGLIVGFILACTISSLLFLKGTIDIKSPTTILSIVSFVGAVVICIIIALQKQNIMDNVKFTCPGVPFVPCLGIVINIFMLSGRSLVSWLAFGAWFLFGLIIYFLWGIRKSKLRKL